MIAAITKLKAQRDRIEFDPKALDEFLATADKIEKENTKTRLATILPRLLGSRRIADAPGIDVPQPRSFGSITSFRPW